jgi:hypothetical protein
VESRAEQSRAEHREQSRTTSTEEKSRAEEKRNAKQKEVDFFRR